MISRKIIKLLMFLLVILSVNSCREESVLEPIPKLTYNSSISIFSGKNQKGAFWEKLKEPVVFLVMNEDKTPAPGAEVTFSVISGGGAVSNQKLKTNTEGKVSAIWTPGNGPEQILKAFITNQNEAKPVYVFSNNNIDFEPRWTSGIDFFAYNKKYSHDNRILESENFLTFSDGASDDVKIIYAKMAEESFHELKIDFDIKSNDEISLSSINPYGKIKIYSIKNERYDQVAYPYGFILFGMDSPDYISWRTDDFWFRREIKHETAHVLEFLLGLNPNRQETWVDTWLAEGLAEYMSGGAFTPITTLSQWNNWLAQSGHINPISIHIWDNFPVPYERTGEYYPAFNLAVRYLLDKGGKGKNYKDIKAMFKDISINKNFKAAFEKYIGITIDYYENNFYNLITEFLKNQK